MIENPEKPNTVNLVIAGVSVLITVITAIVGFYNYIEEHFIDEYEFSSAYGMYVAYSYNSHIAMFTEVLNFYLEQPKSPEVDEKIKHLKAIIARIKKERETFLTTGHLPTGDQIHINRRSLQEMLRPRS